MRKINPFTSSADANPAHNKARIGFGGSKEVNVKGCVAKIKSYNFPIDCILCNLKPFKAIFLLFVLAPN
jgi:hypothetical protein